jgi:peptidoglycan/LPS O-acetylase OafA/YrhL
MKDSPNLDLLRSIAVGLVVLSHLAANLKWDLRGYSFDALGRIGVAVFFVHTSLVLMMSLKRQGGAAVPFFIRRFFRVYPLAVVIVLFVTLNKWLWDQPLEGVLSNLLLIQNLTGQKSTPPPLWSLPYEVQMYLFLPALLALTQACRPLLRTGLLWAGSVVLALLAWRADAFAYSIIQFVPCFIPGVLAFVLGQRQHYSPALLFAGVVLPASIFVPVLVAQGWPETQLLWVVCAALGLVIPLCRPIRVTALAGASKTVATYSYGIYLTHLFAIGVGFYALKGAPAALQWAAFVAVLFILPIAAYRWIEKPGIELGVRLAGRAALLAAETKKSPQPEGRGV